MKIGVFDSGLGGLAILQAIQQRLPEYSYHYLGDTLHLPYGRRSKEAIYDLTQKAVDYLFRADCALIIIACNTASAVALRRIQQEYLPRYYPDRRVLGVVVPTLEATVETGHKKIGLLGTDSTVHSNVYTEELKKIDPEIELIAQAASLLVPLLEQNGEKYIDAVLQDYLAPLKEKNVDAVILGCTHYTVLKKKISGFIKADVISQDEVIPEKLADYLQRHPEIESQIDKDKACFFEVTDISQRLEQNAAQIFGKAVAFRKTQV